MFNASISAKVHVEQNIYSILGICHTCYYEFVVGHTEIL